MNDSDVRKMAEEMMRDAYRANGSIGGSRRASVLSAERRREIGRLGAAARWGGYTGKRSLRSENAPEPVVTETVAVPEPQQSLKSRKPKTYDRLRSKCPQFLDLLLAGKWGATAKDVDRLEKMDGSAVALVWRKLRTGQASVVSEAF